MVWDSAFKLDGEAGNCVGSSTVSDGLHIQVSLQVSRAAGTELAQRIMQNELSRYGNEGRTEYHYSDCIYLSFASMHG